MNARITSIEYYLPEQTLTSRELADRFPAWGVASLTAKTGIEARRIAAPDQCSSDLGYAAATKLLASGVCDKDEIDFLLLCTQSPDYFLPATACLLQHRLELATTAGAVDFNLGCSGYVYGLGLACGLIAARQASKVLLVTAETYSKFINDDDRATRLLFGDAATATLISANDQAEPTIGPFLYGTDGAGAGNLIVRHGGMRHPVSTSGGTAPSIPRIHMNGGELFAFALRVVPQVVEALLQKAKLPIERIDLFVFHQANKYLLDELRRIVGIPTEKFFVSLEDCGNTVSSTIPIALKRANADEQIRDGALVMIVGFGVGYSWGGTLVRWTGNSR